MKKTIVSLCLVLSCAGAMAENIGQSWAGWAPEFKSMLTRDQVKMETLKAAKEGKLKGGELNSL